ncbi:hypothetical protein [Aquabacterium sp.]|uniref:hypothetical protein n=1 Tax=Aquabacterium sp. TaxID=1872578 RepID=UPI003D6D837C
MSKPSIRAKIAKLELIHPTEGACGWVLDVVGFDSPRVRSKIKEVAASAAAKPHADGITVEKMNADQRSNAEITASAVVGWNQAFADADESIGPYTHETALAILAAEDIGWVLDQVQAFMSKRANFFRSDD